MRAGVGLVALLIAVFIMIYMFSDFMQKTKPAMTQATNQANQLAGRSSNGVPIGQKGTPVLQDSAFVPVDPGGKLVAIKVTVMPATNGLAEYFGLVVNDE